MSNQKAYWAANVRWRGPIFPDALKDLQLFYGLDAKVAPLNRATLEGAGKQIEGYFRREERFVTADDYDWFCALPFRRGGVTVLIAFPWCQDWSRQHGTQTDRSIAIYYTGWSEPDCLELLQAVLAKLKARVGMPAAA